MGLVRFNQNSSSNSTLIYRPKPLPLLNQTNGFTSGSIPVLRSGVSDKSFNTMAQSGNGILLRTTANTGAVTTTATIAYGTYLASSLGVAYHLSTADQCLYVLLTASPSFQLIKISDTTGVVTAIGSAFTPMTAGNWPDNGSNNFASMYIDSVSGHLKVICNGKFHTLHKTTGAIVTQDSSVVLGSYATYKTFYTTADGSTGVTNTLPSTTGSYNDTMIVPQMIHSTYGWTSGFIYASPLGGVFFNGRYPLRSDYTMLCDEDKVILQDLRNSSGNGDGVKVFLRSEFDKYIKSLIEYINGV